MRESQQIHTEKLWSTRAPRGHGWHILRVSKSFLSIHSHIQDGRMPIRGHPRGGDLWAMGTDPTFSSFLASLHRDLRPPLWTLPEKSISFSFHPLCLAGGSSARCCLVTAVDSAVWMPSPAGVCIPDLVIRLTRPKGTPCSRIRGWAVSWALLSLPTPESQIARTTPDTAAAISHRAPVSEARGPASPPSFGH